jgi:nucleoside-diphosphate-sugar epimerase
VKLLITGGSGFLGAGLIEALQSRHELRLLDVVKRETPHELIVGDVSDLEVCRRAAYGMDALVIAHMAPNRPEVYGTPTIPFDANVKGTANLFAAAVEKGIRRAVLISSVSVLDRQHEAGEFLRADMPPQPTDIYGLTKVCQEAIAEFYHRMHGIAVAMLRPAYITDADTLTDKYGIKRRSVNWQFIDRRDIGDAVDCALRLPDLGCEAFWVLGHRDCVNHADMERTYRRLGWKPAHDFSQYPDDA